MAGWIKMPLGTEVGLGPGNFVLDGDPASPPQRRGRAPSPILAHVYCGPTAGWIKMALGMEVGIGPGHIVLDGDPDALRKRAPQFSAHFYCGRMAVCIRIPLGMEVGLSLSNIVLDEDPAPPPLEGHSPTIFGQCPLWPNSWMD